MTGRLSSCRFLTRFAFRWSGEFYRRIEFRGRVGRHGATITGTYRWQVSHIASYRALPPFARGRAPFRLDAATPVQ